MKIYTLAFTDGMNYGIECKDVFTFSNVEACYKALRAKFVVSMRSLDYTEQEIYDALDQMGTETCGGVCYGGTYAYINEVRWETFCTDLENDFEIQDDDEKDPVIKEDDITYEVCPECEEEVELPATLGIHTCPKCGKPIISCSMCPEEGRDCANCKFCKEVEKLRAVKEEPKVHPEEDRSDYVVNETEAVMFIGMYVFPRINKYIEFDGWDGETRFVRRLAEDFTDFIYKEADWMTMSIYDYAEEFGQDALEAMLRRERYEEFILHIDYPEWFNPEA